MIYGTKVSENQGACHLIMLQVRCVLRMYVLHPIRKLHASSDLSGAAWPAATTAEETETSACGNLRFRFEVHAAHRNGRQKSSIYGSL